MEPTDNETLNRLNRMLEIHQPEGDKLKMECKVWHEPEPDLSVHVLVGVLLLIGLAAPIAFGFFLRWVIVG